MSGDDSIYFSEIEVDEHGHSKVVNDVRLERAHIEKCPHLMLAPEHYREDGTCRCDDPTHTEMSEWEYIWNPTSKRWE